MAGFINDTFEKQELWKVNKGEETNKKTRAALSALLKSDSFKQVYFIYGDEDYLIRYYKNALIKAITNGNDFNVSSFEGPLFNRNEFIEIANTLPFFSDKRVITLDYTGLLKIKKIKTNNESNSNQNKSDSDSNVNPDEVSDLPEDFFDTIPKTTCLIITDKIISKNLKIVKKLLKDGDAFELNYQEVPFIKNWLLHKFSKSGVRVTERAIDALINQIGVDMNTLEKEADKLISFSNNGELDISDVESISSDRFENKIFKLVELAVTGRTNAALEAYKDVLALNPEPLPILVMMGKQISKYLAASEIYSQTRNPNDVFNKVKVGYFNNIARYCNKEKLESALERYIDLDRSIKEGNLDMKLAPELLITYLAK